MMLLGSVPRLGRGCAVPLMGLAQTGLVNLAGIPASRQYTLHKSVSPSCSARTCVLTDIVTRRMEYLRIFIYTVLVLASLAEQL